MARTVAGDGPGVWPLFFSERCRANDPGGFEPSAFSSEKHG